MTMLTTVQNFCRRTGIPVPSSVYGSSDPQVLQVMGLLEEEGNDLAVRGAWEVLTYEAAHTTVATESQGAMDDIATNGFRYIKNETIWDRTNQIPVFGPINATEWQTRKATVSAGPRYEFRIRGGNLIVNPVPSAGLDWYFEYISKNWIINGATYKQYFTNDADEILLPEDLVMMGLRWRWKKEKGLEYAEDMRTYEIQVKSALGRDGGKMRLSMDNSSPYPRPGVFVPQGDWSL